jgi:hypothetical protein
MLGSLFVAVPQCNESLTVTSSYLATITVGHPSQRVNSLVTSLCPCYRGFNIFRNIPHLEETVSVTLGKEGRVSRRPLHVIDVLLGAFEGE